MTKADEEMTEEQTFNEWLKQLEPSMAVPMYPKALLLDFMKKSFFAGLKQHEHDYLVKTNDLKANCDLAIEGRDIKIKELEEENERLKGDLELWESGGCRATNLFECGVVKELKEQLTKATKLLKWALHSDPEHDNLDDFDTKWKEVEQFLKGENIILEDAQAGNSPFDADEVFNKEMKAYPEEKVKKEKEK